MIEQIRSLNKSKKYNEAIEEINRIENKDRFYFYEAAKAYIALKKYDESIKNINEVLSLKGDWVGAAGVKISALYLSNKIDAIIPTFLKLIVNSSKTIPIEKETSIIFNSILDYKINNVLGILDSLLDIYALKFGADELYNFYRGIVNSNTGMTDQASYNFNSITDFSKFGRHATGGASFKFGPSLEAVINSQDKIYSQDIVYGNHKTFSERYNSVLFASSDDTYFNIFIDILIESISKSTKGKIFHIHLLNPSTDTLHKCNKLHIMYDFFNFSYETKRNAKKIDFACSRFIRLEEIMRFYGRDVVVCDMDSCFIGDFDMNAILNGADIAIKVDDKCLLKYYPWRNFIASFVAFKFNDISLNLAGQLSTYLTYFTNKKDVDYWYADQTALFCLINYHAQKSELIYTKLHKTSHIVLVPDAKSGSKEDFVQKMIEKLQI